MVRAQRIVLLRHIWNLAEEPDYSFLLAESNSSKLTEPGVALARLL